MYVRRSFSHKKYIAFGDLKDVLSETQKIILLIYEVLYIYTQKNSILAYCQNENGTSVFLA